MDIDITDFFNNAEHSQISGSQAEHGQDAGAITWANAKAASDQYNHLDTDEKRQCYRDHVRDYGAWDDEEIASWPDQELNALFLQDVAANIRDVCDMTPNDWDWADYDRQCQEGSCNGSLGRGDDDRVYFSIG